MAQENSSSGSGLNLTFFIVIFAAMLLFFAILTPSMYGIGPRGSSQGEHDIFFQEVETMIWALGYLVFLSGTVVILSQINGPLRKVINGLLSPEKDRPVFLPSIVFAIILFGSAILAGKISYAVFSEVRYGYPPDWTHYVAATPWVIGLILLIYRRWKKQLDPAIKFAALKMALTVLPIFVSATGLYLFSEARDLLEVFRPSSVFVFALVTVTTTFLTDKEGSRFTRWKSEGNFVKVSLYLFLYYSGVLALLFAANYAIPHPL